MIREDKRGDAELVAACNDGGAEGARAFETLYRRHRDYVLRVALRFVNDRELAADALQDTFAELLKRFPPQGTGLVLTAHLATFLYPVAKHSALNAVRRRDRFASSSAEPDDLPAPELVESDAIDAAFARQTPERREILTLRFVDDMPLQDIAEVLSVPLGTVKSRLHLAIRALREDPEIKELFDP